jgi:hypothetical protein
VAAVCCGPTIRKLTWSTTRLVRHRDRTSLQSHTQQLDLLRREGGADIAVSTLDVTVS